MKMMKPSFRKPKLLRAIRGGEAGSEVFEFAMVMPILLMLIIGIFWIGRAYNVYATITRASREGARYAVLRSSVADGNNYADPLSASCTTETNAFTDRVAPVLKADSLDPKEVSAFCQKTEWLENTDPQQCGVVVSFSYPFQLVIPFTTLNASTISIHTQAQMRLEDQPTGGTCP